MSTVSEETQEVVAAETPDTTPPAPAPIAEPEQIYEYQPTDELGRALGGKQVIKYKNHVELADKLKDQNVLLVRKLREQTKKQRLGISDTEQIPDDAPRFDATLEFSPRELSAEERVTLSRDLLDPEKFDQATVKLSEAIWGAKPDVLRQTLSNVQSNNLKLQARIEADAFVAETPDYFRCQDNFETITNWMLRNNLSPVRANFKMAYQTLDEAGLLIHAPVAPPVATPVPVAAPVPAPVRAEPVVTEPPPSAPRISSGLTRQQATDGSSATTRAGDDIVYDRPIKDRQGNLTGKTIRYTGLAAIEAMPSEEFKRRVVHDKTFNQKYEQLLNEQQRRTRG